MIGKDFGVFVLSYFCLLHEGRVSGFVTLGMPLAAGTGIAQNINLPEGFYVSRWKVCCLLFLITKIIHN